MGKVDIHHPLIVTGQYLFLFILILNVYVCARRLPEREIRSCRGAL